MAERPGLFKGKLKGERRSNLRIFGSCLALAFILWLFNGLNENYTRRISVRVSYFNMPEKKVFIHPLPKELTVHVNARGWDLMGIWLRGNKEEVNVDLAPYKGQFLLTNRLLKDEIRTQFSQKMTVNNIDPDTIYLGKEEKISKRIPIVLKLGMSFENHYGLGGKVRYTPDNVLVSGPRSVIEKLQSIETRDTSFTELNKELAFNLGLKQPENANLIFKTKEVKVKLPIFEMTEATYEVNVEVINKKTKKRIQVIPSKVTVVYQTTLKNYGHVDVSLFEAAVDGSKIDTTSRKPLKVQLINYPEFTSNFRLKPDFVNYVIRKK